MVDPPSPIVAFCLGRRSAFKTRVVSRRFVEKIGDSMKEDSLKDLIKGAVSRNAKNSGNARSENDIREFATLQSKHYCVNGSHSPTCNRQHVPYGSAYVQIELTTVPQSGQRLLRHHLLESREACTNTG
jgi:hypothetical protein